MQSWKMLKILMLSEISDRVKGGGKNFLLCFIIDWEDCLLKGEEKDGCILWMTPANSHLYSLSHTLALLSFLKINRMINGPESTHGGCRQACNWSRSPSSQDKHCCCLSFTIVSMLPWLSYMTSALPTEDENSPHWARCL